MDSILTNYRILVCYKLWEHHLDCKRENQLKGCFIRCLLGANQALIADPSAITIQGCAVKFPTLPVSLEEPQHVPICGVNAPQNKTEESERRSSFVSTAPCLLNSNVPQINDLDPSLCEEPEVVIYSSFNSSHDNPAAPSFSSAAHEDKYPQIFEPENNHPPGTLSSN